jgi:hypothetical protein
MAHNPQDFVPYLWPDRQAGFVVARSGPIDMQAEVPSARWSNRPFCDVPSAFRRFVVGLGGGRSWSWGHSDKWNLVESADN